MAYHTELEIVVSQEDILSNFVAEYRSYLPIALAIYSGVDTKSWTLVTASEFMTSREVSLSASLPAGIFSVIPLCGCPKFIESQSLNNLKDLFPVVKEYPETKTYRATEKFEDTLNEIFQRFDLSGEGCLRYGNCKMILEALDILLNEADFGETVLKRFDKYKGGLSLQGFKDWMVTTLAAKDIKGRHKLTQARQSSRLGSGIQTLSTICLAG